MSSRPIPIEPTLEPFFRYREGFLRQISNESGFWPSVSAINFVSSYMSQSLHNGAIKPRTEFRAMSCSSWVCDIGIVSTPPKIRMCSFGSIRLWMNVIAVVGNGGMISKTTPVGIGVRFLTHGEPFMGVIKVPGIRTHVLLGYRLRRHLQLKNGLVCA